MRASWISGLLGLGLAVWAGAQEAQLPRPAANWLTDYAAAKALAKETGRPMLVVFR
jgi:hypothetical protein